jgi:hypothetical protein
MPTTTTPTAPTLAEAKRQLIDARTAYLARRLPTGLMRGPAGEVAQLQKAMFAAQRAYQQAQAVAAGG